MAVDDGRPRGRARVLRIVGAAVLGVAAVGYLGAALAARERVPAGASVGGVAVGGLDRAGAVALLQQRLA
ncbi:MAG TPA: hypothetical protein VE781_06760, partial [Kineosporiaceae bacterium]|nr:hypothetical protein [Kineosporiaceae bacterium]